MKSFTQVEQAPPDPILSLTASFKADPRADKINLGVGVFRAEDASVPVLSSVQEAERRMAEEGESKSYLPIDGDSDYVKLLQNLLLGTDRFYGAQSVGGTSALRLAGDFLDKQLGCTQIAISNPTWANHRNIFPAAELQIVEYDHYDLIGSVSALPEGSAVLFHTCCHNPTGIDPTPEQWKELAEICKQQKLLPVFDTAYQGFGDGIEEDAFSVRTFIEQGIECLICYSCSKNFGLYAERTGALFFAIDAKPSAVQSQLRRMIRANYSNPPCHGARIVRAILSDKDLREQWSHEVDGMRERVNKMRQLLSEKLDQPELLQQRGMFTFCGLEKSQVERMTEEFAIFLPASGRINVTGLNAQNIDSVVQAITTCRQNR